MESSCLWCASRLLEIRDLGTFPSLGRDSLFCCRWRSGSGCAPWRLKLVVMATGCIPALRMPPAVMVLWFLCKGTAVVIYGGLGYVEPPFPVLDVRRSCASSVNCLCLALLVTNGYMESWCLWCALGLLEIRDLGNIFKKIAYTGHHVVQISKYVHSHNCQPSLLQV